MTVYINGTTGYSGPVGTIGDLTTTGNTTLGDASGDTLTINGSTTTLTQGTANGVAYLNGSKVLTTGSALTFNGAQLGVTNSAGSAILKLDGTSAPEIDFFSSGVVKSYIYAPSTSLQLNTVGANPIIFLPNEVEGMRLTSTGLGIGTSSPSNLLTLNKTAGAYSLNLDGGGYGTLAKFGIVNVGVDNNSYIGSISNNNFLIKTQNNTVATFDTSGNLGLGVTPSAWVSGQRVMEISGLSINSATVDSSYTTNGFVNSGFNWIYKATGAVSRYTQQAGRHEWYTAPSGTAGNAISFTQAMTLDASGNLALGTTSAQQTAANRTVFSLAGGSSGALMNFISSAGRMGYVFGSTTDMEIAAEGAGVPMRFVTNGAERARIDSSGNLLVGTTTRTSASINTSQTLQVNSEFISVGSSAGIFWENRSGGVTSNSNWYGFYAPNSTQTYLWNGSSNIVSINNSTGAYTQLSDVNKKKDFEDSMIGLNAVMQLKPTLFRMLDDAEDAPKQLGFIAQEVNEVIPQAYVESAMVDAGGKNSTYIGLNDRPIIAALTKAIQEQQAIIETLKARLDAANL